MYLTEVEGKGGINAKLVAYSVSPEGKKIATFELTYHRYIHGEFMTHRLFSRNAMSSRAVPVKKMLDIIRETPAMPIHWGKNQPGMQAKQEHSSLVEMDWDEYNDREVLGTPEEAWLEAVNDSCVRAECFAEAGYHKQIVNRLVEPFQMMKTVMTATELDNFFWLRLDADAQPEIVELARCVRECLLKSEPELLYPGQWHTPYVKHEYLENLDEESFGNTSFNSYYLDDENGGRKYLTKEEALAISSSCCGQVSYRNLDNTYEKAMSVYARLLNGAKVHASPFEHQASPMQVPDSSTGEDVFATLNRYDGYTHVDRKGQFWSGNLCGFVQHRQLLKNHTCTDYEATLV